MVKDIHHHLPLLPQDVRVLLMGIPVGKPPDVTQGKTSVCLGLLAALRKAGFAESWPAF